MGKTVADFKRVETDDKRIAGNDKFGTPDERTDATGKEKRLMDSKRILTPDLIQISPTNRR